ncbi:hypothetical protein EDB89DRAFT_273471 [Lactarius sanguifluus]|nr:hypothetical protein EDB89DRAFT_273471 [Lactarius sanguifluus]
MSTDNISLHSTSGADSIHASCNDLDIGEIVKGPKRAEIGESSAGDRVSMFSDSVLLEIFDLCRTRRRLGGYREHIDLKWQLVHVCQRWRNLIFASPSRLNLELLCTNGTPVRNGLGCWPAFPIVIEYDKIAPEDEDNILAALEHPDRVRRVSLSGVTAPMWRKMDAATREPFPALTHLRLTSKDDDQRAPLLPRTSLGGGSTMHLQELYLSGISYPVLPMFLSSASGLVHLHFVAIPPTCHISPEAMLTGLAGLTRLETLAIEFRYPIPRGDQRLTAPATPVVCLPALSVFDFKGFCDYLEDLVAYIDAPRVKFFHIDYFNQPVYHIPQLSRFLARSEHLKPPRLSRVEVRFVPWVDLWFFLKSKHGKGSWTLNLKVHILSSGIVRGVVHSVQVLQQLSASLSGVIDLSLCGPAPPSNEPPSINPLFGDSLFGMPLFGGPMFGGSLLSGLPGVQERLGDMDILELLRPFTAANTLQLRGELMKSIVHALELVKGEMTAQILPALHKLRFDDETSVPVERFISARQNAGRPVTVVYPSDEDEDEDEDDSEDESGDSEDKSDDSEDESESSRSE